MVNNNNIIYWPPEQNPEDDPSGYTHDNSAFVNWANDLIGRLSESTVKDLQQYNKFGLVLHILIACYSASLFKPEEDEGLKEWHQAQQAIKKLPKQKKAINELREFLRLNTKAAKAAWGGAFINLKSEGTVVIYKNGRSAETSEIIDSILIEYQKSLDQPLLDVKSGNFLHRFTYGCLLYGKPIVRTKPHSREYMLFFNLTLLLRKHTHAIKHRLGAPIIQNGEPMQNEGKPCLRLATELTNLALGLNLHEKDVDSWMSSSKNRKLELGLMPWSNQNTIFNDENTSKM